MLYITHKNEKLGDPTTQADFLDFIKNEKQFYQANPHLFPFKLGSVLPAYTPILLSAELKDLSQFAAEFQRLAYEERERFWVLQESGIDLPILVVIEEIMKGAQEYVPHFREYLDHPLISTPWTLEPLVTNYTVLDILPTVIGGAAGAVSRARRIHVLDPLYEAIAKRCALDADIQRLSQYGSKFSGKIVLLEREARAQTATIKSLLPKRINDSLVKFLNSRGVDHRKIRGNSYSKKAARKGKLSLGVEFLNKTGLERAKKIVRFLIKLGSYTEKVLYALGAGVVVYDTVQAYREEKDYARAFLTGSTSFAVAGYLGSIASYSTWGICILETFTGEAAIGGLVLTSSPFLGTVVLAIAGAAAIGYSAYKAGEWMGQAYDSEMGTTLRDSVGKSAKYLFDLWKSADAMEYKEMFDFYGPQQYAK